MNNEIIEKYSKNIWPSFEEIIKDISNDLELEEDFRNWVHCGFSGMQAALINILKRREDALELRNTNGDWFQEMYNMIITKFQSYNMELEYDDDTVIVGRQPKL